MGDLTKNFNRSEYACKHCGVFRQEKIQYDRVQFFRENIGGGLPVRIISGYRCPVHNKAVRGEKNSFHIKGLADDIQVKGVTFEDNIWLAKKAGFTGIGIYIYKNNKDNFVHVDSGKRVLPAVNKGVLCWIKYEGKEYEYMTYEQIMLRNEIKIIL